MHRLFLIPAVLAAGSACTFDATGLTVPSQQPSGFSDESDSTATVPTTGVAPPTGSGEAPSTDTTTSWPGSSEEGSSTDPASSSSEEDTGSLPAVCGDGVVAGDEECDDGPGENADDGSCTSSCLVARCGDGHLQAANGEACDAGGSNVADPGYGECSLTCTRGPYCGDGEVQGADGEECEPQGVEGGSEDCQASCVYQARIVFVTSVSTDGDLGGLTGADQLCDQHRRCRPVAGQLPGVAAAREAVDRGPLPGVLRVATPADQLRQRRR